MGCLLLRVVLPEVLVLSQSLEDVVGTLLQLANSFTAGRLRLLQVKSGYNKQHIYVCFQFIGLYYLCPLTLVEPNVWKERKESVLGDYLNIKLLKKSLDTPPTLRQHLYNICSPVIETLCCIFKQGHIRWNEYIPQGKILLITFFIRRKLA